MYKESKFKGILYAVLSAVAFGCMPILVKIAYNGGANPITVVFLRFLFSTVILLTYFLLRGINFRVDRSLIPKLVFLGIVGYAATCITLFLSYSYISAGLATIIHFIYPAIVTLFSVLIFKEQMKTNKLISLILSIAGIYVLIGFSEIRLNAVGVALAIVSGIFYSIYILEIGHSEIKNIESIVITFYVSLFSCLGILLYGCIGKSFVFDIKLYGIIAIISVSLICTVIALNIFAKSIKIIGSSNASILSTLEPITSIILSAVIFNEKIAINTIIGSILIIMSVYILIITPKNK